MAHAPRGPPGPGLRHGDGRAADRVPHEPRRRARHHARGRRPVGGRSAAGSNFNVVPGSAYFTVDGRYNPEEDLEGELKRLTTLIEHAAGEIGADVTVKTSQLQPSAATDPAHPAAAELARVVTAVTGEPARFEMCAGILEIRWYAQLGIPSFGYGAGRLDVSHGPEEYIDEAAMRRCATVYALYAASLLT
ncbi:M20/M25/M40 family metallo-hydrolase [Nonomuraea sp. NPDC059023]|uniref:M20/M25/M40 family metallo-hydrolase n=1 Tax=unclassified Nonomuraea TaxID=2593643 RepID=UPI00368C0A00